MRLPSYNKQYLHIDELQTRLKGHSHAKDIIQIYFIVHPNDILYQKWNNKNKQIYL